MHRFCSIKGPIACIHITGYTTAHETGHTTYQRVWRPQQSSPAILHTSKSSPSILETSQVESSDSGDLKESSPASLETSQIESWANLQACDTAGYKRWSCLLQRKHGPHVHSCLTLESAHRSNAVDILAQASGLKSFLLV